MWQYILFNQNFTLLNTDLQNDSLPKNWIQKLYNLTWEMELLIIGFSIHFLVKAPALIDLQIETICHQWQFHSGGFIIGFLNIVKVAVFILIVNLSVNLLLRAYWVGLVGLKSVFKSNIDVNKLGLQNKFKTFHSNRIKDLENNAVKIDGICSIVFSFSFLQIFLFLSFAIYLLFLSALGVLINGTVSFMYSNELNDTVITIVSIVVVLIFIIGVIIGLISIIDFIGIGFLKRIKNKFFSNLFYACNRFVRFVTLSFVYESLYYTILSNVSKRRICFVLVGYAAFVISVILFDFTKDNLFPQQGSDVEIFNENYMEDKGMSTWLIPVWIP